MKYLHKKVGSVALVGMMVFGGFGLSNRFISHAIPVSPSPNNMYYLSQEQIENRRMVVKYEGKYNYLSEYLEKRPKNIRIDEFYRNRWQFEKNIEGDLKKFKGKKEAIYIQIGSNSCFRISFKRFVDYHSQSIYNIVKKASEEYNFEVVLVADARSNPSLVEMLARMRSMFAGNQPLLNDLIKRPVLYYNESMIRQEPQSIDQVLRSSSSKGYARIGIGHLIFLLKK